MLLRQNEKIMQIVVAHSSGIPSLNLGKSLCPACAMSWSVVVLLTEILPKGEKSEGPLSTLRSTSARNPNQLSYASFRASTSLSR